jgi:hypothetical protein
MDTGTIRDSGTNHTRPGNVAHLSASKLADLSDGNMPLQTSDRQPFQTAFLDDSALREHVVPFRHAMNEAENLLNQENAHALPCQSQAKNCQFVDDH